MTQMHTCKPVASPFRRLVTTATLVSLGLTACGDAQGPEVGIATKNTEACSHLDLDVLRVLADYDPKLSLEELYEEGNQEVIVTGTVDGFGEGPAVPVEGEREFPERYVVMIVKAEAVLAGPSDSPLLHDGYAYVPLEQGPVDAETGAPVEDPVTFGKALPRGTRTVLFLGHARPQIADRGDGAVPAGAVLGAVGPQDLYLDDCGQLVGGLDYIPGTDGWAQYTTIEELEAGIERLAG